MVEQATDVQAHAHDKQINALKDSAISQDHIIQMDLDKDVVLAVDDEWNELARFEFVIANRQVTFKFPTVAKYPTFVKKFAQLLITMAQYAPNLQIPENLTKAFSDDGAEAVWKKLSATAIASNQSVKQLVLDLFFNYLDGRIAGFHNRKVPLFLLKRLTRKWFSTYARIDDLQKVFSACLCVDELIKKNARITTEKKLQRLQGPNSNNILPMKSESPSKSNSDSPSSSYEPL
jgi:hypothetical protein